MFAICKTNVHRVACKVWPWIVSRGESNLATLRKKTGFAFMLCKKALEANENDLKRAEQWLKEEAAKQGWERALQNRRAAQGLIGVFVDREHENGFLIEVNCESDFVSRNEQFKNLVLSLMDNIVNAPHIHSNITESTNNAIVRKYDVNVNDLDVFKEKISAAIVKLGENIKLNRASIIKNNDKMIRLFGYTHASTEQSSAANGIQLGKYGTIVAVKQLPEVKTSCDSSESMQIESVDDSSGKPEKETDTGEEDGSFDVKSQQEIVKMSIEEASKIICQHIIGVKPKCVSQTQEQETVEKARIAANENTELESDALVRQKLLVNENITVKDYLKFQNIDVIDFIRFECGESID
ncbi:elongation factor Ts-like protein [Leptotrombidium deliense]|uniref:Elongation factor Ts, mitochondrial n=1 Tax=Leptotrombidium deliense TaxID=299467 RepID=A0A443SKT7_9ACAR|nr:elongation factor Ts-like protein [Leptotrombidium deliense]